MAYERNRYILVVIQIMLGLDVQLVGPSHTGMTFDSLRLLATIIQIQIMCRLVDFRLNALHQFGLDAGLRSPNSSILVVNSILCLSKVLGQQQAQ